MSKKSALWLTHYLPVLAWMGLIFLLSSQPSLPGSTIPVYDFILKKSGHMTVYAILFALVFRAQLATNPKQAKKLSRADRPQLSAALLPWLIVVAYAISDETHQGYVAGRHPSLMDVGYDSLGALIAFLRQYRYI